MEEYAALLLFVWTCIILFFGYPVAFSLAGSALIFAGFGLLIGWFDAAFLSALPNRLYGIMTNDTLVAVPLFIFMGLVLERSRISANLLETMALLFGPLRGGMGVAVAVVGMMLAASTGIVGATVVTMGLIALPSMLKHGYAPWLAAGTICAAGTLGQIIPPSIILVLLGDVIGAAYQQAQLAEGVFAPRTLSVGDLFAGAVIPGLILVAFYILFILTVAALKPSAAPAIALDLRQALTGRQLWHQVIQAILPPLGLIVAVLGSILAGVATPTEAAAVGAVGCLLIAHLQGGLDLPRLQSALQSTTRMTSMVFTILIGAALFSLVFRGFNGDDMVRNLLKDLPGGVITAFWAVMGVIFLLGFFIDFIEIIFVVMPVVGPVLLGMGLDPLWLGVMVAINLQTSFLTPPFGFSLFYLRGVAPPTLTTGEIYRGVVPFIGLQLLVLGIIAYWPQLVTWLPRMIYGD